MYVYVSGPMRGYPKFNFPLFDQVTVELEAVGMTVANPAKHDRKNYPDIEKWEGFESGDTQKCPKFILPDSLQWDFSQILQANAIVMLPFWEKSAGAKAERFVAECVGKKVFLYIPFVGFRSGYGLILDPRQQMVYPAIKDFDPNEALVIRYDEDPVEPAPTRWNPKDKIHRPLPEYDYKKDKF